MSSCLRSSSDSRSLLEMELPSSSCVGTGGGGWNAWSPYGSLA